MARTDLQEKTRELLAACGFKSRDVQILKSGGFAIEAKHPTTRDLPPYFVVPTDQFEGSELKTTGIDQILRKLGKRKHARNLIVGSGHEKAQTVDEIAFDLIGLSQARKSYRDRLKSDVRDIVETPLAVDGEEVGRDTVLGKFGKPSLWVVVAPGGWGKTSFCRHLALGLANDSEPDNLAQVPFPILVEFTREVEALPFEDLLGRFCRQHNLDANRSGGLGYLLKSGRAVLIVDGFDELASTFGLDKARVALERVLKEACAESGRALVSSRTQFYELTSGGEIIGSRLGEAVKEEHASLLTPDPLDVVKKYLGRKRIKKSDEEELDRHFGRLPTELGSSPLAARWTATEYAEGGVEALGAISSAVQFYDWYLQRLCEREEQKRLARIVTDQGEQLLDIETQLRWLEVVALEMLNLGSYEIGGQTSEDVAELLAALLDDSCDFDIEKGHEELTSHAVFDVAESDDPGVRFVHPSVREFLIARAAARGAKPNLARLSDPPPELARFLGEYAEDGEMTDGELRAALGTSNDPVRWRISVALGALDSAQLQNNSFSERRAALKKLFNLNFEHANLTGRRFERVDLSEVAFDGANLNSAEFIDCDLRGASFQRCHLDDVQFLGCQLEGADFESSTFIDGYVSEDSRQGPELADKGLREALEEATAKPTKEPAQKETEAWHLGEAVGQTFRVFVPKGRQPKRSCLEQNMLRNKRVRQFVLSEVLPVLMRPEVSIVYRGRPRGGNKTIVVEKMAPIVSWLKKPDPDDQLLEAVLTALLRREPTEADRRDFSSAIVAQ